MLQRITFSYKLSHLDTEAVDHYISQRVQKAGFEGMTLFNRSATKQIAQASGGIPRLVNILSHKALLVAYGKGEQQVDSAHVTRAIEDTEGVSLPQNSSKLVWMMVCALALITAGLVSVGTNL